MTKERTTKKKTGEPRKLKPLNNLGDYIRSVPALSKTVERIDKHNASKKRFQKKAGQDKLVRSKNHGQNKTDQQV